jgi:hypothetical protein
MRHLAGVFVGTAAQPGGLSGAMDLKFPLCLSTLLFLHEHTLSPTHLAFVCVPAPISLISGLYYVYYDRS